MGKFSADANRDAYLNNIINNADQIVLCSGQPANFAAAQSGGANYLGEASITSANMTLGAGSPSGRTMTVAGITGINATNGGTADHVALVDTVNSVLLLVDTISPTETLTAGNNYNTNSFTLNLPAVA